MEMALRKLIGDAITSATDSLDKREKELNCPDKTSIEHYNKHCSDLKQKIDEAKASGIDDKISKAKSKYDNHYNGVHYLIEDARKGALGDIEERQKTLSKLKQDLEKFIGKEDKVNPATEILKNLTDGLQKFLGYQETSKGYDGSGIVYSDLDRLCDGVMSFLHGVLHNIQPKLGHHNGLITNAIDSLKDTNLNGFTKYKAAIAAVASGVRAYNEKVAASNESVKSVITSLQDYTKNQGGKLINDLNGVQVEKIAEDNEAAQVEKFYGAVKESLEECQQEAETFSQSLDRQTDNIDDLNSLLKLSVNNVHECVKHETKRLNELAEQQSEDFKSMEKKTSETLEAIRCNINDKISIDVKAFFEKLKEYVQKIWDELKKISANLAQCLIDLQSWMESAKKDIEKIREKDVKKILDETTDGVTGKMNFIDDQRKELLKWREKLDGYTSQFTTLSREVNEAIGVLGSKFTDGVSSGGSAPPDNIEKIMNYIKGKVDKIKGHVGESRKELGPADASIQQNWDALKKTIGDYVNKIKGTGGSGVVQDGQGVKQIKEGIKKYASGFADHAFEKQIVTEWLKEIVNTEESFVSSKITQYAFLNRTKLTGSGDSGRAKTVRNAIISALPVYVEALIQEAAEVLEGATVGDIANKFRDFALQIEEKLKDPDDDSRVDGPVKLIELQLQSTNPTIPTTGQDANLKSVVQAIAKSIVNNFKHIANELQRFAKDSHIDYLTEIDSNAGNINKQFEPGDSSYGGKIDTALQQVHTEIGQLHHQLEQAFESSAVASRDPSIAGHVDQAIGKLKDTATELSANAIPQKLEDVAQKIKDHLSVLTREITEAANVVNAKLENFMDLKIGKPKIGKPADAGTLQKIRDDLTELQSSLLKGPMKEAEKFVLNAGLLRDQYIKGIQERVDSQVKEATEKITTQAKKQYVNSVKGLLTRFAEKVYGEVRNLPEQISNDLKIGHKGFMKKMEDKFIKAARRISSISPTQSPNPVPEGKSRRPKSPLSEAATTLNTALRSFFDDLQKQDDFMSDHDKVAPSKDALTKILNGLMRSRQFDNNFSNNLVTFKNRLTEFSPKAYGEGKYPYILESFKKGFAALFTELEKAYVNVYDGHPKQINLSKLLQDKPQKEPSTPAEQVLTPDGENMSKVFLSILEIISEDLTYLKTQCLSEWYARRIHSGSSLGTFLQTCGYRVVTNRDSQNGELQYKNSMKGEHIYGRLVGNFPCLFATDKDAKRAFETVYEYLQAYYAVCHLSTSFSKKRPCSIYDMLAWCTSLLHNPVYIDLTTNDFSHLFDKPKKKEADSIDFDGISLEEPSSLSLAAYPQKIAQSDIHLAIIHVTSLAPVILTTIVGYGDEFTTYAVDYRSNALNFTFPSSAGECLNMLLELLRRMFPVFRFLHHQCTNLVSEQGWYSCKYGKDVKSAKWPCSDHSNSKPNCQPTCQANTEPNCQPRSPLMSYLNDCLPGHLPHQVSAIGCKAVCATCPKSTPGQPCLTPLGFRGFSGSTKTGKDLCKVLTKFFGNGVASPLLSVAPKPPSNLAEHFQFALSFVKGWSHNGGNGLKTVIENSAKSVSIDLYNEPSKLTDALRDAYRNAHGKHGDKDHLTAYADVSSLAMAPACNDAVGNALCAPYVASLCSDTYAYFAEKHANTYLSWAIYLPWTFWDLLNNLYDSFCSITCADWGCRGCLRGDKCKSGKHGVVEDEKKPDDVCQCDSIVSCRGVAPTLYQYGFSFGEASTLNDEDARKGALEDIDARRISLGQLAGQLSGLIGGSEDVKNAILNGLHSNVNELVRLLGTSCGDKGCNDHRDQINTLNEKLNKLKNKLKDDQNTPVNLTVILSKCKLNGLDGPLKELKDAITEKIEKLNKDIESLKKADKDAKQRNETPQNASEIDKLNKDLQSHEASKKSLDTLNELCGYADKIDSNNENPKKLLENLCTGLEKFLGHSNGNYTGTGIVYSDLDRLCDGVMSFLHGVLSGVKNDENVTTYDNMLDSGSRLDNVLSTLRSKIGSGRVGLSESVTKVKEWLGNYNEEVGRKTGAVKNKLGELITKLSSGAGDGNYYKEIAGRSGQELKKQLEGWQSTIGKIQHTVDTIELKLNDLDLNLRHKVRSEMNDIGGAVRTLNESAWDDAFGRQVQEVDRELSAQTARVEQQIVENYEYLRNMLESEYQGTFRNIRCLNDMQSSQFGRITSMLQETQEYLAKFDGNYKDMILGAFDDIKREVANVYNTLNDEKVRLAGLVSTMQKTLETLSTTFATSVKGGIKCDLESLRGRINGLTNGMDKAPQKNILVQCALSELGTALAALQKVTGPISETSKKLGSTCAAFQDQMASVIQGVEIIQSVNISGKLSKSVIELSKHQKTLEQIKGITKVKTSINNDIAGLVNELNDGVNTITQLYTYLKTASYAMASNVKDAVDKAGGAINKLGEQLKTAVQQAHEVVKDAADLETVRRAESKLLKFQKLKETLYGKKKLPESPEIGSLMQLFTQLTADIAGNGASSHIALDAAVNAFHSNATGRIRGAAQTAISQAFVKVTEDIALFEKNGEGTNQVKTVLRDLKSQFATLGTYITRDQHGSIDQKIKKIETHFTELNGISKEEPDGVINQRRKRAEELMNELKDEIQNKIRSTLQAVVDTDLHLRNAIDTVYEALLSARKNSNIALETLKNNLLAISADAFRIVKEEVRSLFTHQKLADLSALHKLAERQAKKIKSIIDTDVTNGVKGLLNHMGTWLPHNKSPVIFKNLTYFSDVAVDSKYLLDALLSYTTDQVKTPSKAKKGEKENSEESKKVQEIQATVNKLLSHLSASDKLYNFDYAFQQKLSALTDAVTNLSATKFAGHQNPELLDALKKGMLGVTGELNHAYVNRYDSQKFTENLIDAKYELTPSNNTTIITLTEYGEKCSKVFLTILNIAQDALCRLHYKCEDDWQGKLICEMNGHDENPLGNFLQRCGFDVAKNEDSKDGELKLPMNNFSGQNIHQLLNETINGAQNNIHLTTCKSPKTNFNVFDIFDCLITHLNQYNQVGHIATFTASRTPCSIFDMLCWLSGLPHNAVFQKLTAHCNAYDTKGDTDLRKRLLDAVAYSFPNIGKYSHNMLTTIVGTGNADTIYGSDLANNSLKFKYPASAEECLSTLLDILRRLLPVCRFLYKQCGVRPSHFGWRDCQYGKNIPTAKWPCTDHSTDKANSQPTTKPTCQPKCQPTCQPNCQPTSPLMSYLNDCLPGHLPHQLMSVGCKSVCSTCPSTSRNGMPCLTPLGFRAFSGSTKTGKDLCEIIKKFFANVNLSSIFCLGPKPPVTLPEHFGFAMSLVGQWADTSRYGVQSLKAVIESTITDKSIALYDPPTELMNALTNAYGHGVEGHTNCDDTHITSLTSSGTCNSKNSHSAPYLSPLCSDVYKYLANKNAALYLSWIAYLPWAFQQYLECLLDAFKNIFCHEWGCHVCFYNDKCKKGKHGESEHPCQCSSLVKCKGVAPTLYSYGFTFNDVLSLNASKFATTCSDFQQQLSKVTKSNYFTELFKQCDELLWKIREPFSLTLLALWSLSLLYLLHIAVVRLDVLRIRSHLRSPSSHRIAAQSLLAAARVKALANVKYFSP
ncbi:hypothetical protein, conserved [Babesia ovata]|uniref:C3H1-type domain-containing protein n=1 Tax=Babesia ovata TaxID=189622 RepID=A0A2H6KJQ2_9APIC|nr:uncharacterized protein BOVATA_047100 [Babesia ovata]GBE63217.1 hypothetical protein, conserved [Babesia ovata]